MKSQIKICFLILLTALLLTACGDSALSEKAAAAYTAFTQSSVNMTTDVRFEQAYCDADGNTVISLNTDYVVFRDDSGNTVYSGTVQYGEAEEAFTLRKDTDGVCATCEKHTFSVAEDDIENVLPAADLLTSENYTSVSKESVSDGVVYILKEPSAPETWMVQEKISECTAKITADKEGNAASVDYSYAYEAGELLCRVSVSVTLSGERQEVETMSAEEGKSVSDASAFMKLVQVKAYLNGADTVAADCSLKAVCNAGGMVREETSQLTAARGEAPLYRLDKSVTLTDYSRSGDVTKYSQCERFADGTYTVEVNGEPRTDVGDIDSATMDNYCTGILLQTIPDIGTIGTVSLEQDDNGIYLVFSETAAIVKQIRAHASLAIYQDATLLETMSQDYTTQDYSYKLRLNSAGGLPECAEYSYTAQHSISDFSYTLEIKQSENFNFALTRTGAEEIVNSGHNETE